MKNKLVAVISTALLGLQTVSIPIFADDDDNHKQTISISVLGTYKSGIFDESAAEIPAYDRNSERLFVTNADENTLDVLDVSNPAQPGLAFQIDLSPYGGGPNSVSVKKNGIVAVAIENDNKQLPGSVVFFKNDGTFINQLTVGALPDMLTFSPNGNWLVVANEGEPDDNYLVDPEGSVSIINTRGNARRIGRLTDDDVQTADFQAFNTGNIDPDIRIYGPNATVAQDLEPEYITISRDSKQAYVALQENNAIAVVDIENAKVTRLFALGTQNHNVVPLDVSNKDDAINITTWPVRGFYQPDAIASYQRFKHTFIVTANEGDSRDYDGFSEEERVKDVVLDPVAFPNAATLQAEENLGRLKITTANGDIDGDGDFDQLFSYGGRSFSIWSSNGFLVYDSRSDFEEIIAEQLPDDFNSTNDENDSFDNRSDDKGPEPEAVAIGKINGKVYAFVGLERVGGIMVYDITNPFKVEFLQYLNNRDFSGDAEAGTAGDLGPEGIVFISKKDSPIHKPLLAVTNEVSGSTTLYKVNVSYGDED